MLVDKKRGIFDAKKKRAVEAGNLPSLIVDFSILQAKPILNEIKNREKNDPIRIALINYLIVRAVTIFEVFMINEAHKLATKYKKKGNCLEF